MTALYRSYTGRVRVIGYWLVRVALFLCTAVALYALGWRNGSVAIGAVLGSSTIAYLILGSQHDALAGWVSRKCSKRFRERAEGKG